LLIQADEQSQLLHDRKTRRVKKRKEEATGRVESGFGSEVGCCPRCCRGVGVGEWTSLDESGEKKRGMSSKT